MLLAAYVEYPIAMMLMIYPNAESNGSAIPQRLKNTKGSKQYPRIDADRASVSAEAKCLLPPPEG